MAVAFRAWGESSWADATSTVVTKPVGLAAGDWMVGVVVLQTAATITPPSGFTLILDQTNSTSADTPRMAIYWKIADSGDAAASDFTFSFSATSISFAGIICGTGSDTTTPVGASNGDNTVVNDITPSWDNTITPPQADCLLILFAAASQGFAGMSNQAIANDNPTWTEVEDTGTSLGANYVLSVAYSSLRSATSATGNSSLTGDDAAQDWVGQIVAIQPPAAAGGGSSRSRRMLLGIG